MNSLYFFLALLILAKLFVGKKAEKASVDQWYWLKYRESVRKQKICPPDMPEYLLEKAQWYPPLFGYFISKLPDTLFKNSLLVVHLLYLTRVVIVVIFFTLYGESSTASLLFAVGVYLSAPILFYYDNQINSRVFGAIILDLLYLFLYLYLVQGWSFSIVPLLILTIILMFTHKMSHQLYLFLILGLSIAYHSIELILLYIIANLISFVFLGYKKYFIAHLDIVTFWHRNRYKLGAHQFYESEVYGDKKYVGKNRVHGFGIKSIIKKAYLIIGLLPFSLLPMFYFNLNFSSFIVFFTILFILLTSFIPLFYCIGSGNLYQYNMVSFISFYIIESNLTLNNLDILIVSALIFLMSFYAIFKYYLRLKSKSNNVYLNEIIAKIKSSNLDRILVIPFQLPDEIAYKTNKTVFWGGHGYGFKILEPYFPVFNKTIEETVDYWNLQALVLEKNYWPDFFYKVGQNMFNIKFENEQYIFFEILDNKKLGKN